MSQLTDVVQAHDLLNAIAAVDPQPWYPSSYANEKNVPRDSLDKPLNELRYSGFVRMTDWQPQVGQGYHITTEGRKALNRPKLLSQTTKPVASVIETEKPERPDVPVTRILVLLQASVFVLGLIYVIERGGSPNDYLTDGRSELMAVFGVSRINLIWGRWWTLWSYALVHAGIPHLCLNLFAHMFDARIAEMMYGRWRFIVLYLLAVFAGGVGAIMANPDSLTVGSSGGLCGVITAQLVWVLFNRERFTEEARQKQTRDLIRAAILITAISLVPGVSWAGHLGGAIGGGLAAWLTLNATSSNQLLRWVSRVMLVLFPLGTGLGIWYWLR